MAEPRVSPEQALARLAGERERTLARLTALRDDFDRMVEASHDSNADDEHDPEGHTIAFERSQVDAHLGQARRHLAAVDAAVARVREGRYGTCTGCGREIPEARLEARPTAETCVTCAARR